jgi:hypothetical protein
MASTPTPGKRGNPIDTLMARVKQGAAAVDSTMMKRMPADFQKMHAKKPKKEG